VVCNTGIRFDPVLNGKPLAFDFYGLYNGVVTMTDRATGSVWLQVGGRAVKGSLCGVTLKTAPLMDTTWKRWKELHPDTLVMSPKTPYREFYDPKGIRTPRGFSEFPSPYFQQSMAQSIKRQDKRLPAFDMVLAVKISVQEGLPEEAALEEEALLETSHPDPREKLYYRAYPIKTLRKLPGVVNDTLGEQPLSIFFEADTGTATAFSRLLDGQLLTFEVRKRVGSRPLIYDKETGSRWTIEGKAVSGTWAGRELTRLDSYMSEWYGWASYFPQTTIYGQGNRPPANSPGKPLAGAVSRN
jgi:hypothetical protein